MSREERKLSELRPTLEDALREFESRPVALPALIVSSLLDELCGEWGICLARADYEQVRGRPPTNPRAFAELVAKLECLGTDDELFIPVLELVLRTFQGVVRDSAAGPSPSEETTSS